MFNKNCLIGTAVQWQHRDLSWINNISQLAAKMFYYIMHLKTSEMARHCSIKPNEYIIRQ